MVDEVAAWLDDLDEPTYRRVMAAIVLLSEEGPSLGRPMVDTIRGSRFPNMKELRPTTGSNQATRVLFAFDPARTAILLVAGDKSGSWQKWYRRAIPLAERRYERHLKEMTS